MNIPKDARCCKRVYGDSMRGHPCRNRAKVFHDGEFYCGVHDPVKVAERRKKSQEKRTAEWEAARKLEQKRHEREARRDLCEAACEGVDNADLSPGLLAACLKKIGGAE